MSDKIKEAAWDNHWKAGHLSSLSAGNETSEPPEALAAWDAFFGYMQTGAIVLDLATGNGVIAAYAQAHAKQNDKRLEVIAVDQADIDPENTLGENAEAVKGTMFLGGIEAEDLPFEDGWFDAVMGQYAIEYTDTDKSVSEIARVLKKNGILRFVCHAKDGALVQFNTPKATQCRYILEESGVFEALEAAVKAASEGEPAAGNTREILRNKTEAASAHLKTLGDNPELELFLNSLIEAYIGRDQIGGLDEFLKWLSGIKNEIRGQIIMMEALAEAALDEESLIKLGEKISASGFGQLSLGKLEVGPEKVLLAYTIEGMKA